MFRIEVDLHAHTSMQSKYILIASHIFQAWLLREELAGVITQEAKPHLPGLW